MANPNFSPTFSTNEVYRDLNNNRCLTDDLDAIEADIVALEAAVENSGGGDYAPLNHTHEQYALTTTVTALQNSINTKADSTHTHTEYASTSHTHDYAATNHTHTGYETSGAAASALTSANAYTDSKIDAIVGAGASTTLDTIGEISAAIEDNQDAIDVLNAAIGNKANVSHTHTIANVTNLQSTLDDKASSSHTHTIANVSNLQSALDGKAASSHTHDYLSTSGGTVSGNLIVNGVVKVQNQQAFYYNTSTNSQTIGTNNATGGTTICAGSSASVAVNGAKILTASIVPRDTTGTYNIGNSSTRYNGIYLKTSPNVSSDMRLKKNVEDMDLNVLADFINDLNVVSYNYVDDAENADARIGLIAQEVIQADDVMSEFFVEEDENGYYSLRPADFVFPLIAAVQKLTREVEELKAQLA